MSSANATPPSTHRMVPCPQCGKETVFDARINPYRPFCSHRCKQIDLGAWSSESYYMPQADEPSIAPDETFFPPDAKQRN